MEFHEKLVLLRAKHGYTQAALALKVGVTRQSVYKWEKGESYPEAMTLLALRDLFGITIDALIDPAVSLDTQTLVTACQSASYTRQAEAAPAQEEAPASLAQSATEAQGTADATPATNVDEEAATKEKTKKRGFFSRLFG